MALNSVEFVRIKEEPHWEDEESNSKPVDVDGVKLDNESKNIKAEPNPEVKTEPQEDESKNHDENELPICRDIKIEVEIQQDSVLSNQGDARQCEPSLFVKLAETLSTVFKKL